MKAIAQLTALTLLLGILGCSPSQPRPAAITLATTTSTQDSGLLDELVPAFEQEFGIKVKVVAVGSGQALELGRRGDADVLLTHAPAAEKKFMAEGWGHERQAVMYNDFVIVGPANDPGQVKQHTTTAAAFRAIYAGAQSFVSRADESGTHKMELTIWQAADIEPRGDWYIKAGTGMAPALRMANEKTAYVLADRATYLALRKELELVVLLQGDPQLINHYSVITVNQAKHPHVHEIEAQAFARFLLSEQGQNLISSFGKQKFGEPLFMPAASESRK